MSTKIRFGRNPLQAVAHLTDSDDDGRAFVFCGLPGGRPFFTFDLRSPFASAVANAPQCDTFAEFKRFVTERFGDQ